MNEQDGMVAGIVRASVPVYAELYMEAWKRGLTLALWTDSTATDEQLPAESKTWKLLVRTEGLRIVAGGLASHAEGIEVAAGRALDRLREVAA